MAQVRGAIVAARESLEQGDAESALQQANAAAADEARTRLADEWGKMRPAMAANLDSVRGRLDRFGRGRTLPVGVMTPGGSPRPWTAP